MRSYHNGCSICEERQARTFCACPRLMPGPLPPRSSRWAQTRGTSDEGLRGPLGQPALFPGGRACAASRHRDRVTCQADGADGRRAGRVRSAARPAARDGRCVPESTPFGGYRPGRRRRWYLGGTMTTDSSGPPAPTAQSAGSSDGLADTVPGAAIPAAGISCRIPKYDGASMTEHEAFSGAISRSSSGPGRIGPLHSPPTARAAGRVDRHPAESAGTAVFFRYPADSAKHYLRGFLLIEAQAREPVRPAYPRLY